MSRTIPPSPPEMKTAPRGPFFVSAGECLRDEPTRLTQGVPPFALRAIGCADVRFGILPSQ